MDPYLERLQRAIKSATQSLDSDALNRPNGDKWSAAQILEHLYLSYDGSARGFERCLNENRPLARTPTLRERIAAVAVTGLGYFPSGRKSPERANPRGMAAEDVVGALEAALLEMDGLITRCELRFGRSTRILDHPALGPLTAKQWRKFHWVHGHHHVKQIARVRS